MEQPPIVDQQGQARDWNWLVSQFGPIELERAEATEGSVYRVIKIQAVEGPAVQVVNVSDQDGEPGEGIRVVRYWPGAPALPAWPSPTSVWRRQGVFGETDANGDIGYGMGQGDYYSLPAAGPSAVWIADPSSPSDAIFGLGMLAGSSHRHLDVYFQLQPVEALPEEPADESREERWQMLLAKLDAIIAMLEA